MLVQIPVRLGLSLYTFPMRRFISAGLAIGLASCSLNVYLPMGSVVPLPASREEGYSGQVMVYGGDGYYDGESTRGMGMSFHTGIGGERYRMRFGGYFYGGSYEKDRGYLYSGGFGYMGAEYVFPYENLEFFFGIENGLGVEVGPYVESFVYSYELFDPSTMVIIPRATWVAGITVSSGPVTSTFRLSAGLPSGIGITVGHESGPFVSAGAIFMSTSPGERLMWYMNLGMHFR